MSGLARKPGGGRPAMSDFGALELMARLEQIYIASGNPKGVKAIAREIVERVSVLAASDEAAVDRLRRKYREMHRQRGEFCPHLTRAEISKSVHSFAEEAEETRVNMDHCHALDVMTAPPAEEAGDASVGRRVTARIVTRPPGRRGRPVLVALRIVVARDHVVEVRVPPGIAREIHGEVGHVLGILDAPFEPAADDEAQGDV